MWGFRRSRREERGEREGRGKEEEGGGQGGSRVLDISDGQRASIRRTGSVMTLEGDLCSSMSNFVHDVASKMYVFAENIFAKQYWNLQVLLERVLQL